MQFKIILHINSLIKALAAYCYIHKVILKEDSEGPYQTVQMCSLIRAFSVCICLEETLLGASYAIAPNKAFFSIVF